MSEILSPDEKDDVPQDEEEQMEVLFPDVPQDEEEQLEVLIPGINMDSSVIIVCEFCGKSRSNFSSQLMFTEHVKKHQNPHENCDLCGKIIGTKHQVRRHKKWYIQVGFNAKIVKKNFLTRAI